MQSFLIALSEFTLTGNSYPNSVCFLYQDQTGVFSLQSVDSNSYFFSLRIFSSYFYTIVISSDELRHLYSEISAKDQLQYEAACLNHLLSRFNITIELNNFNNPVTVRLYSQSSHPQLLMILNLKWMSPDEHIKLYYSTDKLISNLTAEAQNYELALSVKSSAFTKLEEKCNSLNEKVNMQQTSISNLENTLGTNHHTDSSHKLAALTDLHINLHNQSSDSIRALSEQSKQTDTLHSEAKSMLSTLNVQSNNITELNRKILSINKDLNHGLIPTYN